MAAQEPAPRLFLVVLGGRVDGGHIEQHDVRFVAGASIDATIPQLREQWFGRRRGLHIDSWLAVETVAGWRVKLRPEPFEGPQRLWFVNGGGYEAGRMAELHEFALVVAASPQAARARGKRGLLAGALQRHTDDLHPIGELPGGLHVHLIAPAAAAEAVSAAAAAAPTVVHPLVPDWFGYRRIDRG